MPRNRRAARNNPQEVKHEPSWKDKGNRAFAEQNYEDAIRYYHRAIQEDPTSHIVFSNLSATFASMRRHAEALQAADKVVELKADWPKGYFRRGHALESLLRYNEAAAAYKQGLALSPDDPTLGRANAQLTQLLEELKITQAQEAESKNPDTDKFTLMVQWLKDGGAKFPKLYLQYYSDDYRGVHCLARVPADDVILYVPHKYIMTSDVAKESVIGRQIISSGVELRSKHSYLAAYLLQERENPHSFWKPYTNILPERYANMPLFFDEATLAHLQGSLTLAKIADRIDSLRREYDNIKMAVPEFGRFTQDEFVWARLVVITRIFGLVIDGKKTDGLVPYADMLNHRRPRETKWTFNNSSYGFTITSLKTIQRGEQVYDSYGRKCNSRFFVNYGFALDENADNEAVLRMQLPQSDPHFGVKLRLLGGRPNAARREFQVPADYREKKCKELFSFMRFVHVKNAEFMLMSSAGGLKLEDVGPISPAVETAALQDIKAAAQRTLAGFEHPLQHDEALLEQGIDDYNHRCCIIMRMGEKRVLQWFIDLADTVVPLLRMNWKDLKKVVSKVHNSQSPTDHYINDVVAMLARKGPRR